jgi:hypothetical protein
MKPFFLCGKTLSLLAVGMAAAISAVGQAQTETAPTFSQGNLGQGNSQTETAATPATVNTLPANVVPGSPLAEVVKLIQAGVDVPTMQSYIGNSQNAFNLDADKIIFLKDEGAPSEVINAMMDRDKALYASAVAPQAPAPPQSPPLPAPEPAVDTTTPADTVDTAPPAEDVTVNYFYDNLTPYGSWLNVDGVGQCWRPTAVIYDAGWRPYCDRGHWVYTDYGWYWDSDYGWGATFHYGRWFHHARYGWCWYPDTVWAPSWVTWRSDTDYCGWAPLPPFAVYTPGGGFFFRGVNVGFDCNFGLGADSFVFVSPANFCDRHPRSYAVRPEYVTQIFSRTRVINNFNANGKTIVNHGFGADGIASVTHQRIEPVHVSTLPNAGRQGWRGEGFHQTMQRNRVENNAGRNFSTGNNINNNGNAVQYGTPGQAIQQRGYQPGYVPAQPNGNNQAQSQTYFNQQQQQQRQYNNNNNNNGAYGAGNNRIIQNNQNGWQQNRTYNNSSITSGAQQHGAEQLQEHQYVAPTPPRQDDHQNYVQAGGRNLNPPPQPPAPSQNQPQPRNSGNGGNGNGSTSGGGNNSGWTRQNH